MKDVVIADISILKEKIRTIKLAGAKSLHIVSDFDQTLTKGFHNGKRAPSSYAQLRDSNLMPPEYAKKAYELYHYYYPIEKSNIIPLDEKCKKMMEWWSKHLENMRESGLTKEIVVKMAHSGRILPREGLSEFFSLLSKNKIPLLIFSAGLGDVIVEYLSTENHMTPNVHIIANFYDYDSNGRVSSYKSKIIHTFNKNEVELHNTPYLKEAEQRKNVILLGDSLGDIGMTEGIKHDCIIRIGFLHENPKENLNLYLEKYDVVILNDGPMDYVIQLIKKIIYA